MTAVKSKQLTDNHNMVLQFNLFPKQDVKGKSRRITSSNYESGDIMNNNYVTQEQFSEHKAHMDTRFDTVQLQIKNAVSELKNEINDNKVTSKRFWIGISVPAILSLLSLIVTVLVAIFF